MPYVITTRPNYERMPAHDFADQRGSESRRAVATLEEARGALLTDLGDMNAIGGPEDELVGDVLDMTESGGTIGPLPDGSVIEVARVRWGGDVQAQIDAYNAQQGAHA